MQFFKSVVLAGMLLVGGTGVVQAAEVTVKSGDTLWQIGQDYGIPYQNIMTANQLNSDLILIGQRLVIPDGKVSRNQVKKNPHANASRTDIDVLAQLVRAEAQGESFTGKTAVAAVIMNRIESEHFPDTISGVIYQSGQFSPVSNGSINLSADEESYQAARAAVNGNDPTGGAVYFYNPATASDHWIRTRPVTAVIDNHNFAK